MASGNSMDVQPYHTTGLRSVTQQEIKHQVDREWDRGIETARW
jgi:hypothetical protein